MVYWDPVQKQENFLLEGHRSKKDVLIWLLNLKVSFGIEHPHLHIKPNLYVCRRVQGSQIFKQNRIISISSRLIEFWWFGLPVALGGEGVDGWGWGWLGGTPTHVHTHVHAHTCMRGKHDNFMQMATPIGGIPGNSVWCHMHMHMHVHACEHMWKIPSHHPHPIHQPPLPRGNPRNK